MAGFEGPCPAGLSLTPVQLPGLTHFTKPVNGPPSIQSPVGEADPGTVGAVHSTHQPGPLNLNASRQLGVLRQEEPMLVKQKNDRENRPFREQRRTVKNYN